MRFSHVVMTYFVLGALMWGGGAIAWDESGVGQFIIEDATGAEIDEDTTGLLSSLGGPIQMAAESIGGGLLATWNVLVVLVSYLFWPIVVLDSASAPAEITVLFGGSLSIAFVMSFLRIIRGSL